MTYAIPLYISPPKNIKEITHMKINYTITRKILTMLWRIWPGGRRRRKMSRMRSIEEGFREIKANDPGIALTKTALRRLVTTGEIPSVRIGTKYLFDLDAVERYLRGELQQVRREQELPPRGVIRRIGV